MEEKQNFMKETKTFLEETERDIQELLEEFQWTENDTLQNKTETNKTEKKGTLDDKNEMLPESIVSETCGRTVTFDKDLQLKVIMEAFARDNNFQLDIRKDYYEYLSSSTEISSEDMFVNFTQDERLAMYDYVIQRIGPDTISELPFFYEKKLEDQSNSIVNKSKKGSKHESRKYRNKNRPLTYTDAIRDLIATQMNELTEDTSTVEQTSERVKNTYGNTNRFKDETESSAKYSETTSNINGIYHTNNSYHRARSEKKEHSSHKRSRSKSKTETISHSKAKHKHKKSKSKSHKHKKSKKVHKHKKRKSRSRSSDRRHKKSKTKT